MSWPVFPLNTDGIDPAGSNVTIRNVNITNFDDSINKTNSQLRNCC